MKKINYMKTLAASGFFGGSHGSMCYRLFQNLGDVANLIESRLTGIFEFRRIWHRTYRTKL